MPEMYLRKSGFTYSTCKPLTKDKEIIQKLYLPKRKRYICQNQLDKACFQHGMVCGYFKDLPRTTSLDRVLRYKAFNIAKNLKYYGYQRGLLSMVYKFFEKNLLVLILLVVLNQQLADDLHKPVIKKFEKR